MIESIARTAYIAGTTYSQLSSRNSGTTASPQDVRTTNDSVSISKTGRLSSIMSDLGFDTTKGYITLDDIQTAVNRDRSYIRDRLRAVSNELGIDGSDSIVISNDFQGRIVVSGDFPKREQLETRLNNEEEFSNVFRRLSANASLLKAAKEYIKFAEEYEKDPEAAVARYYYLFDGSRNHEYSLEFRNGEVVDDVQIQTT